MASLGGPLHTMVQSLSSNGTILVVDDQPANLRVVSALLSKHGYQAFAAASGPEALDWLKTQHPDLILLDMMMPGMDGFALIGEIRHDARLRHVPVIFLTAAHDRELLLRAFESGAVDYVTKPFMPEELLARVQAHVRLKLSNDRLQRLVGEKQTLVNLVAHDLKNPLTSVLFASEVLLQDGCKPERIPRYLQMIHDSAGDAIGYIRSYLETQQAGPRRAVPDADGATSLRQVVDWLHDRYALQMEARGMRLDTPDQQHSAADLPIAVSGQLLRQVAENLITNALKYAPGSVVSLGVRPGAAGYMQLLVEDRGPGIPPGRQRELFKPFTRLTDEDPANGLSSGLGLSLARQILGSVDSQLWYEDREGGGARFVMEVPIHVASRGDQTVADSELARSC